MFFKDPFWRSYFWRGLCSEGLIYGGKCAFQNWLGWPYSWEHRPSGGLYFWRGDLKENFLRYRFGEIIFRGAYFRNFTVLGGVYMRKLAPARVSYRDDFLISYRVYMLTGSFHISYLKVHLHLHMLIKCTSDSKWQTLRMRYLFQSTGRPIWHRNGWSFRVYMIQLRDFVTEWNSLPGTRTEVNSRRGDSHRHDICGGIM